MVSSLFPHTSKWIASIVLLSQATHPCISSYLVTQLSSLEPFSGSSKESRLKSTTQSLPMEELQTKVKCHIKTIFTVTQTCLRHRHKEHLVRAPRAAWPHRPRQLKWQVRTTCSTCTAHYRSNIVYQFKEWVTLTATWDKSSTWSKTMKTWAIETKWAFCRSITWGTLLKTTIKTCYYIVPTVETPSSPLARLAQRLGVRGQPHLPPKTKSWEGSLTKNSSTIPLVITMKRLSCRHNRCRLKGCSSSYIEIKCSQTVKPFRELHKLTELDR